MDGVCGALLWATGVPASQSRKRCFPPTGGREKWLSRFVLAIGARFRVTFADTCAAYGIGVHRQEAVRQSDVPNDGDEKSFPSTRSPSGPSLADST